MRKRGYQDHFLSMFSEKYILTKNPMYKLQNWPLTIVKVALSEHVFMNFNVNKNIENPIVTNATNQSAI